MNAPQKQTKSMTRFVAAVACIFTLLSLSSLHAPTASAAGAVEMQVERIVVLAISEYNDAMAAGDPAGWLKYFTETVRRYSPQSAQQGKQAFSDYYRTEFDSFRARWITKKMIISGRSAAVEFEWDAVRKPGDTPVKLNMVAVFELAPNGKFDSVNFYFDPAKLGSASATGGGESK